MVEYIYFIVAVLRKGRDMVTELKEEIFEADEQEVPAPEELIQESMEAVEQLTKEIEEENEVLEREFSTPPRSQMRPLHARKRRVCFIGVFSSAASLIVMGIALLLSLNSPEGIAGCLKIAPIMLVFLGIEILYAVIRNKSLRIKFSAKSVILVFSLVGISFGFSLISALYSVTGNERINAETRICNITEEELSRILTNDSIKSVTVTTELFGDDISAYRTPADLTDGDRLNVSVTLGEAQITVRDFAKECRTLMDGIFSLSYKFGTLKIVADDGINRYTLNLDCLYQSDYTAEQLAPLVNYFGDDIPDSDIPDLADEE